MSDFPSKKHSVIEKLQLNKVLSLSLELQEAQEPYFLGGHAFNEDYLVVLIDDESNFLYAINTESTPRFPIRIDYTLACVAIESGEIEVIKMDWPPEILLPFDELTTEQQNKAQERFDVIQPLIKDLEATLRNSYGENVFQKVIQQSGKSKQYVYDSFYGYLVYGRRKAGLAFTIGKNIFHESKEHREVHVKLGRPNENKAKGKVLDDYDLKVFQLGKRLYQKRNGPSIKATFELLLSKHYYESRTLNKLPQRKDEKYKVTLKSPTERPTINQFYFWLMKECGGNIRVRDKSRRNPIEQKKDYAGRTGSAFADVIAFGQCFELDETPFEEELVSIFDLSRSTKIGKATLYFIIDRLSKYITGFFITTEKPSYKTVRQALFNAGRDKRKFLEELGFSPDEFAWDFNYIPLTLFVDNAEFKNKISEGAVFDLQTQIKFARKGKGDDKPNVEQMFDVFRKFFEGISKGFQSKSLTDIYNQLARKHASLTVAELNIITMVYVNYHNNYRFIKEFNFDRSLLQDEVPPIPAKLAEWSLRYRPGYTFHYPDEELYMKLLSKGEVSVHQKGIYFKKIGLWYNCEWILKEGYQEKGVNRNRVVPMICRYNENFVDLIFIQTDAGLKVATLDTRSAAFYGLSHHEALILKDKMNRSEAEFSEEELMYRLGFRDFLKDMLIKANKEKQSSSVPVLSEIKKNAQLETYINRFADINHMLQAYKNEMESDSFFDESDEIDSNHLSHRQFDFDESDEPASGCSAFDNDED